MSGFLDRMFGRSSKGTGRTAKDRLQFILVHDRINLPPERLKQMKEEILAVISKYVEIDRERVDIALEQRDRSNSKIIAEIPFQKGMEVPPAADIDEDSDLADVTEESGAYIRTVITSAKGSTDEGVQAEETAEEKKETPTVAPKTTTVDTPTPDSPEDNDD
jgi:cell division topological specificity factor